MPASSMDEKFSTPRPFTRLNAMSADVLAPLVPAVYDGAQIHGLGSSASLETSDLRFTLAQPVHVHMEALMSQSYTSSPMASTISVSSAPPSPTKTQLKLVEALFGTSVAQVHAIPYSGKNTLMFVFGDVSVRKEGVYRLRYRCFDIFSGTPGTNDSRMLADCVGAPFRVYGSKECPRMEVSTELTCLVSTHGVKVNIRKKQRG